MAMSKPMLFIATLLAAAMVGQGRPVARRLLRLRRLRRRVPPPRAILGLSLPTPIRNLRENVSREHAKHRRLLPSTRPTALQLTRLRLVRALKDIRRGVTVVDQTPRLRANIPEYVARYPAAEAVRTNLGERIWAHLESYRFELALVAILTGLLASPEDREGLPTLDEIPELKAILDQYIPDMETYIRRAWSPEHMDLFKSFHNSLEVGPCLLHTAAIMQFIKMFFRSQPIYFLIYNFYVPFQRRMTWPQLSTWALGALQQRVPKAPVWSAWLRGLDVWNPATKALWNRAEVEVHEDIQRRFSSIPLWC